MACRYFVLYELVHATASSKVTVTVEALHSLSLCISIRDGLARSLYVVVHVVCSKVTVAVEALYSLFASVGVS